MDAILAVATQYEQERHAEALAVAKYAAAAFEQVLTGAISAADFDNRLALVESDLRAIVPVAAFNEVVAQWRQQARQGYTSSRKTAALKDYYEMMNVGSSKYTVSFHDGISAHDDGSPFYDIKLFSNRDAKDAFVRSLQADGYVSRQGTTASRKHTAGKDFSDQSFAGVDFSGQDLSGANLRGTDLTDANLYNANLTDANFYWAYLTGAILTGANLTGADLTGADLTNAILYYAKLTGADLSGADLSGADLNWADLTNAKLFKTRGSEGTILPAGYTVSDGYVVREGTTASRKKTAGKDLSYQDLSGQDLSGADLSGADLTEADLEGAVLGYADFTMADLTGANLRGAYLAGANLSGANLSGADLTDAVLAWADLRGAIGDPTTKLPPGFKVDDLGYVVREGTTASRKTAEWNDTIQTYLKIVEDSLDAGDDQTANNYLQLMLSDFDPGLQPVAQPFIDRMDALTAPMGDPSAHADALHDLAWDMRNTDWKALASRKTAERPPFDDYEAIARRIVGLIEDGDIEGAQASIYSAAYGEGVGDANASAFLDAQTQLGQAQNQLSQATGEPDENAEYEEQAEFYISEAISALEGVDNSECEWTEADDGYYARKTAADNWDTGEVEIWFSNNQGLYYASRDAQSPLDLRVLWEAHNPNPQVDIDSVDWDELYEQIREDIANDQSFEGLGASRKTATRYAEVSGARSADEVEAYLPSNYGLVQSYTDEDGRQRYIIAGEDQAGWTLEGYVMPRCGSGLIGVREISQEEAASHKDSDGGFGVGASRKTAFTPTHIYNPIGWDMFSPTSGNMLKSGDRVEMIGPVGDPQNKFVYVRTADEGTKVSVDRKSLDKIGKRGR